MNTLLPVLKKASNFQLPLVTRQGASKSLNLFRGFCSLDRALQTVELKPTYEDVFQVEGSSLEEYLQQVHEMTVVTAIEVSRFKFLTLLPSNLQVTDL